MATRRPLYDRRVPSPSRMVATLAVIAAAAIMAACNVRTDEFCCTTAEQCTLGGAPGPVNCTDPLRPFCDNDGTYGHQHECIADPLTTDCQRTEDCTTPER